MVRSFPSDGWSALPTRFGFWPENPTTAGVVSSRVFSARLPEVCRQVHDKQPFGMFKGENGMNYTFSTFLIEAILIIFFIKIVYVLLRPLRQPRIVCEIIVRIRSYIFFYIVNKFPLMELIILFKTKCMVLCFEGWDDDRTVHVRKKPKLQLLSVSTDCELHMRKHRTDGILLLLLPHGCQNRRCRNL